MKNMTYILIGLVVLGMLAVGGFYYLGQKSKNGVAPGLVDGTLTACPSSPNCVLSETHAEEKHAVDPLPLSAWGGIPSAVAGTGGAVTEQRDNYIAATYASKTFGFVDDVEFRKAEDAVHVRSASRVGYSDRGVNRARVEELRELLRLAAGE
jgi:uncharacterized protein (DUF1499 family)